MAVVRRSGSRGGAAKTRPVLTLVLPVALFGLLLPLIPSFDRPASGVPAVSQWYKTDLHTHSVLSGDGPIDIGIMSQAAKARGYNALFVTDHQAASNFPISAVVANHLSFDDDPNPLENDTYGTLTTTLNELVAAPVNTGTKALHLEASSATHGETFSYIKRGPNFRSGDIILQFAVNPTRIDPGSGLYVSASIGGDPTIINRPNEGYTTAGGVISPGKSTVFVWQLGGARSNSPDPEARVITYPLSYQLNSWNSYSINLTAALNDIPIADRPDDDNAVVNLKLAAGASNGSAEGYFDTVKLDASSPVSSAAEFVHRNTEISSYDTPAFKLFPSLEMGLSDHSQRFNYAITQASEHVEYKHGTDGILPTQATGYPSMLNHPGLPGGVTEQEAIATDAYGADLMEVAERGTNDVMIRTWDSILKKGVVLPGTWTSDAHRVAKFGPATYIWAPSLDFDAMTRSAYEGRLYLANNDFPGRVLFGVDGSSTEPYPARYPVYVSDAQKAARAYLSISDGLSGDDSVVWISNGGVIATDRPAAASYAGTKTVALSGASTYVRAEVRRPDGTRKAMTEPLFFIDVPGLAAGPNFNVAGVTTPDGRKYTKTATKGIVASSWDATKRRLSLTLEDPAGSLVELRVATGSFDATGTTIDGSPIPATTSRADFDAATTSTSWYDSGNHLFHIKASHAAATGAVAIDITPGSDSESPTAPGDVTGLAVSARQVNLSWSPASDNVGVAGYTVTRDGVAIGETDSATSTFVDRLVSPATTYSYAVEAFDAVSNHSSPAPVPVTTPATKTTIYTPVADSYVSLAAPGTNYGGSTSIRADGSPVLRGYLRFDLGAAPGAILGAKLRLLPNSTSSIGFEVRGVDDDSWGERSITANNAPAPSALVAGASGRFTSGVWAGADASSITTRGLVSIAVSTTSAAAMSFASREVGANAPQLVVETSPTAPTAGPVSLTTGEDSTSAFTPAAADADGDTLRCTIDSVPSHGVAVVGSDCGGGTYNPGKDFSGNDSFVYRVSDGTSSATSTVNVTVTSINDAPAPDVEGLTAFSGGQTTTIAVSATDVDGDCPLTFSISDPPDHGSLAGPTNVECVGGGGTADFSYTPATRFTGTDTLSFTATDPSGAVSQPGTIGITVQSGNNPPVTTSPSPATTEDQPVSFGSLATDPDGDVVTCSMVSPPTRGSASVNANCSGGLYTPSSNFNGIDSFTYSASDGAVTTSGQVNMSVSAVNDAPVAAGSTGVTDPNRAITLTLSGSDVDGDCPLVFNLVTGPAHGNVSSPTGGACAGGVASATVTYTPAPGYTGADSFSYRATDPPGAQSAPATAAITVASAVFASGFETGTMGEWSSSSGLAAQSGTVLSGTYAAEASTTSGATWARKTLGSTHTDLRYRVRFRLESLGANSVNLLKHRTTSDGSIAGLYLDSKRRLSLGYSSTSKVSTRTVALGAWAEVELRVVVNGASSTTEVRLNGDLVPELSLTGLNLGTSPVGILQLGELSTARTYHIFFDDVVATLP